MKEPYYIIDAFNLMLIESSVSKDIDKRGAKAIINHSQKLLNRIAAFAGKRQLSVIFDGENPGIGLSQENIDIVFSGKYIDADTVIKRIVDDHQGFKGHLTVVSSDRSLISYAMKSTCQSIPSADFALLMEMSSETNVEAIYRAPSTSDIFKEPSSQSPAQASTSKQGKTSKRNEKSLYSSFNEDLSPEEINDLIRDKKSYKGYQKSKSSKEFQTTKEKDANDTLEEDRPKEAAASLKKHDKKKKMKKISLDDLKKEIKAKD